MADFKTIFKTHPNWQGVEEVCSVLTKNEHLAWLAGGCVRDALLGVLPKDFDVVTDASPDAVEALFENSVAVGKQFGVIIIPFEGYQIEVATFRTEGEYADGRRPTEIEFASPEEDAQRRDFTVNALFYDLENDEVKDFVNGQSDLADRELRTVGLAEDRFREDKLRLFRAIRFVAQLGFHLDDDAYRSVVKNSDEIRIVSRERIRDEFLKLLRAENVLKGLSYLEFTGLFQAIFGSVEEVFDGDDPYGSWTQTKILFQAASAIKLSDETHLALFALHMKRNALDVWLKDLRLSNKTVEMVKGILRAFYEIESKPLSLARQRRILAENWSTNLIEILGILGQQSDLENVRKKYPTLPEAFLSGDDLLNLGLSPGKTFGECLDKAFDLQLEGQLKDKAAALAWTQKNYSTKTP